MHGLKRSDFHPHPLYIGDSDVMLMYFLSVAAMT
jgi:hypothetical protein